MRIPPAKWPQHLLWQTTVIIAGLVLAGFIDEALVYRQRGDRFEGVKSKPVGAPDLELIGAVIDGGARTSPLPEDMAVSWFLEREGRVFLTIRERQPETFYWLDKIPASGWRAGAHNTFTWPSGDILAPLGLEPTDLAVLVRIDSDIPRVKETVAPALVDHPPTPSCLYRFTFRPQMAMEVRAELKGPGGYEEVLGSSRRLSAHLPHDIRWQAAGKPPGHYRIEIEGIKLRTGDALASQEVRFHRTSDMSRCAPTGR